jgi:hypothetical protein
VPCYHEWTYICSIFISVLGGDECSASCFDSFTPRGYDSQYAWRGVWRDPSVVLDVVAKRKTLSFAGNQTQINESKFGHAVSCKIIIVSYAEMFIMNKSFQFMLIFRSNTKKTPLERKMWEAGKSRERRLGQMDFESCLCHFYRSVCWRLYPHYSSSATYHFLPASAHCFFIFHVCSLNS